MILGGHTMRRALIVAALVLTWLVFQQWATAAAGPVIDSMDANHFRSPKDKGKADLAEACRAAAQARNARLADPEKAFLAAGKTDKERLYVRDKVHLSRAGHEVVARTVAEAIARRGR
jgi:lysophospholipase L1-like esterase